MKPRWFLVGFLLIVALAVATSMGYANASPGVSGASVVSAEEAALPVKEEAAAPFTAVEETASEIGIALEQKDEPVEGKDGPVPAQPPVVGQGGTCISGFAIDHYHQPRGAGWTVTVTPESGAAKTMTLDAQGKFKFENLGGGTWVVKLDIPGAGWRPITPSEFSVTLSGTGKDCAEVRIKLEALPCLEVTKYDANGKMGFSQMVGIPGWEFTAENKTGTTLIGVTNGEGKTVFENLATGVWTVTEATVIGWIPASGYSSEQVIDLISPRNPGECQTLKFVNRQIHGGCIQVRKVDAQGKPLAGWTITLIRNDGTQASLSKTTNSLGIATFDGLALGEWTVKEAVKENWRSVGPQQTVVDLDTPGWCVNVTFQNEALGCVAGYKINQFDQGLIGWTIVATNKETEEQFTTVTDKNGFFQFHELAMGTWTISEVLQTGWEPVTPAEFEVEVTKPIECVHVRFKNKTNFACVDVFKKDATDGTGIPGWEITLKPAYGGAAVSGTTDGTGHVRFNGLTPGAYVISETMQTGWVAVTPQKQTVNLEATGTCGVVTFKNRQSSGGMILPPTGAGCSGTHVVQPGNTLFSIARWYGSSVSAIKQANRLWSDTIWVGQKLCIP